MRARGQEGDRSAPVAADHGRLLRVDGVEHGDEIVGGLLEERCAGGPSRIGEAGAAPIEEDHATERRQSLDEARQRPEVPHGLDVAEPPGNEHDVDRPVANDLVGHVLVADACVSGLGPQHDPQYAQVAPVSRRSGWWSGRVGRGRPATTRHPTSKPSSPSASTTFPPHRSRRRDRRLHPRRRAHAGRVIAVDVSPAMITVLDDTVRAAGLTNVDVVHGGVVRRGRWPSTSASSTAHIASASRPWSAMPASTWSTRRSAAAPTARARSGGVPTLDRARTGW